MEFFTVEETIDSICNGDEFFLFIDQLHYDLRNKYKNQLNQEINQGLIEEIRNDINQYDFSDYDELTYSSDCFKFLSEYDFQDFTNAINVGCRDIVSIANYYYKEVQDEAIGKILKKANVILDECENKLSNWNSMER